MKNGRFTRTTCAAQVMSADRWALIPTLKLLMLQRPSNLKVVQSDFSQQGFRQ